MTDIKLANALRFLSMDAVEQANSGHPGMPMGMADVAMVLFRDFLKFNPQDSHWINRDRFVLSAGHGSMLLYSLLYLTGYADATIDDIKNFRQLNSKMAGHPEYNHLLGVETTTGPLGQGFANAVGMAIAERHLNAIYGDEAINYRTFVMAGDGCLMEGISHEAAALAGHLKLNNLIVLWDNNNITIDGAVNLSDSTEQLMRFRTYGWDSISVDGHNPGQIQDAIRNALASDKPCLIACRTQIGKGAPNMQGTHKVHGSPLGKAEIQATREALNWQYAPFEIPNDILNAWRAIGQKSLNQYQQWQKLNPDLSKKIQENIKADNFIHQITKLKSEFIAQKSSLATRVASQQVLGVAIPNIPLLMGGSADLTGSNGTRPVVANFDNFLAQSYHGRYVNYGIREHAMAAAMNGMALSGLRPYGGTFLAFADYARPAIRLAALMGLPVVFVMTHDSIGLGEDGPTHQPVEHLASLRAIPNLLVFRPADAIEVAECWEIALSQDNRPSIMVLTRQNLPLFRDNIAQNQCQKGAYIIQGEGKNRDCTIIATGSEVEIALNAAQKLREHGHKPVVISMPSMELFRAQSAEYRHEICGDAPIIAIEAAVAQGWHEFIGAKGQFIGMQGFGASGPYKQLYEKFGITAEAIVEKLKK